MIVSLAGTFQTCVFQKVYNLTAGTYNLTFQYIADNSINLGSSAFGTYVDNLKANSLTPTDYNINT